jgi:hypothetical protein
LWLHSCFVHVGAVPQAISPCRMAPPQTWHSTHVPHQRWYKTQVLFARSATGRADQAGKAYALRSEPQRGRRLSGRRVAWRAINRYRPVKWDAKLVTTIIPNTRLRRHIRFGPPAVGIRGTVPVDAGRPMNRPCDASRPWSVGPAVEALRQGLHDRLRAVVLFGS